MRFINIQAYLQSDKIHTHSQYFLTDSQVVMIYVKKDTNQIQNTVEPHWPEHRGDHGNPLETRAAQATEGQRHQPRKQIATTWGNPFDFPHNDCMLSVLMRIASMRRPQ